LQLITFHHPLSALILLAFLIFSALSHHQESAENRQAVSNDSIRFETVPKGAVLNMKATEWQVVVEFNGYRH
jgi:hypothetical protein